MILPKRYRTVIIAAVIYIAVSSALTLVGSSLPTIPQFLCAYWLGLYIGELEPK